MHTTIVFRMSIYEHTPKYTHTSIEPYCLLVSMETSTTAKIQLMLWKPEHRAKNYNYRDQGAVIKLAKWAQGAGMNIHQTRKTKNKAINCA